MGSQQKPACPDCGKPLKFRNPDDQPGKSATLECDACTDPIRSPSVAKWVNGGLQPPKE